MKSATAFAVEDYEAADLAAAVLGLPEPESEEDTETVEERFYEQYRMDLETFAKLASKLVPMCAMDRSELTGSFRRGFVREDYYIVKQSIHPSKSTK